MKILTHKRLLELLHYDPETGIFTWKIDRRGRFGKIGDIAGSDGPQGYKQLKIEGRQYRAHRTAWFYMTGKWPEQEIDHINRIKYDNRFCNLRDVSPYENQMNKDQDKLHKSTGIQGVIKNKDWFIATVRINKMTCYLGRYPKIEYAIDAIEYAKKKIFENSQIPNDYVLGQLSL